MKDDLVLVAGAGGFIAGHLVADLRRQGYRKIRAVDIKPLEEWYQKFDDVENLSLNLEIRENCFAVAKDARQIYSLAANMGGIGFIENNKAVIVRDNTGGLARLRTAMGHSTSMVESRWSNSLLPQTSM